MVSNAVAPLAMNGARSLPPLERRKTFANTSRGNLRIFPCSGVMLFRLSSERKS